MGHLNLSLNEFGTSSVLWYGMSSVWVQYEFGMSSVWVQYEFSTSRDHSEPRNLKTQMSLGRRGFLALFFCTDISLNSLNKDLEGDFIKQSKIALKIIPPFDHWSVPMYILDQLGIIAWYILNTYLVLKHRSLCNSDKIKVALLKWSNRAWSSALYNQ